MFLLVDRSRSHGVLTSQVSKTWTTFGYLQDAERIVAFTLVPVAMATVAIIAMNARRVGGVRCNPVLAAASIALAVGGIWILGARIVVESDDWVGRSSEIAVQIAFLLVPLIAIERVAATIDAELRPLRIAFLAAAVYLVLVQGSATVTSIEATNVSERWGELGALLVLTAVIQVLGALSVNEAIHGISNAADRRYTARRAALDRASNQGFSI